MNKLDLKAYGVSEMNKKEMEETDGGLAPLIVGGLLLVAVLWPKRTGDSTVNKPEVPKTETPKTETEIKK